MRNVRISIFCVTFVLIMLGIVMVYSTSAIYAYETYGDSFFFLKHHLIALGLGILAAFTVMSLDCGRLGKRAMPILGISVALLIIVLIPKVGVTAGGAKRWINLGLINFQPSELAKIAVIIYLADFIRRKGARIGDFLYGFLPPLAVTGCVMFLVLLEPDMGTSVAIGAMGLVMLFIAGARMSHISAAIFSSLPLLYYMAMSAPYRKRRLLAFINPWLDERGAGFQIVQSFLALGSGGVFGVGLGQSRQKLFYLPASHTDFIFSIIGEELGLIGTVSCVALFAALVWQGARAAFKVEDTFRKYLIFGIFFMIGFEVILNVGVATGILPTKGLPLPFVSYGGTSLVAHMAAIGIALNAMRE